MPQRLLGGAIEGCGHFVNTYKYFHLSTEPVISDGRPRKIHTYHTANDGNKNDNCKVGWLYETNKHKRKLEIFILTFDGLMENGANQGLVLHSCVQGMKEHTNVASALCGKSHNDCIRNI